jgi:hypothetical protein
LAYLADQKNLRLRAQRGDEMAQLVFDLGWRCHCLRNFFTQ